jgi:hypothetical protein
MAGGTYGSLPPGEEQRLQRWLELCVKACRQEADRTILMSGRAALDWPLALEAYPLTWQRLLRRGLVGHTSPLVVVAALKPTATQVRGLTLALGRMAKSDRPRVAVTSEDGTDLGQLATAIATDPPNDRPVILPRLGATLAAAVWTAADAVVVIGTDTDLQWLIAAEASALGTDAIVVDAVGRAVRSWRACRASGASRACDPPATTRAETLCDAIGEAVERSRRFPLRVAARPPVGRRAVESAWRVYCEVRPPCHG